eukprot:SAG31_NODE_2580_length_5438_cov_8.500843_8_plen_87_part_00
MSTGRQPFARAAPPQPFLRAARWHAAARARAAQRQRRPTDGGAELAVAQAISTDAGDDAASAPHAVCALGGRRGYGSACRVVETAP